MIITDLFQSKKIINVGFITFVMFITSITNVTNAHSFPVSSEFGWRTHPITGVRHFHTGVDFAYETGTPIRAVKSGKVVYSARWGGYGNCIIIEHPDGDKTLYAHCDSLVAHYKDDVIRGETIATVGNTGISTGPHLHLEWWHNGVYCNPLRLLSK